jgi:hypothetical protein
MQKQSPLSFAALFLLFALLAGAVVYFVLQPAEVAKALPSAGLSDRSGAPKSADLAPELALAESQGEAAEQRSEVSPDEVGQDGDAKGHRIRVLDLDGSPLPGVQVHAKFPKGENGESDLYFWSNYPDQLLAWRPEPADPRSNALGIVTFSESAAGAVAVVLFGKAGYLLVKERIDENAPPIDLQLHEAAMVEVRVIRADDSPVTERLVYGQLVDPRDPLTPEGEPNFSLRIPAYGFTDDDGIAWLPLALPLELRDVPDIDPSSLLARAETREHLGNQVGHNFALTDYTPIELRLPPNGKLRLRLDGYPVGVRPTISVIDPERNIGGPRISLGGKATEDPLLFEFADLPFGKEFKVRIDMPRGSGGAGSQTIVGSGLPGGDVSGPTESEPTVERVLTMSGVTGLFGRFTLEDGAPIQASQLPSMTAEAKGFGPNSEPAFYTIYLTVFEGGEFFARLRNFPGQEFTLDLLREVQFSFVQAEDLNNGERGTVIRRPVSARVPLAIPQGAEQADLGTIVLQAAKPLLIVRTIDQQNQALPGASVWLSSQSPASRAQDPELWENRHFDELAYTDQSGEYWVVDRDWASELGLASDSTQPGAQVDRIRVDLRREGFLSQTVEIPASQTEVEVRMEAAGSLAGSVLRHPILHNVRVQVVAPGAAIDPDPNAYKMIADVWTPMTPQHEAGAVDFEIDPIPAGVWDVSFSLAVGQQVEIFRVRKLNIVAGELNHDPRLQAVDLSTRFSLLRVQLLDEAGVPFSLERNPKFVPIFAIGLAGEQLGDNRGLSLHEEWLEYPVPPSKTFDLSIHALGYQPLHRNSVAAGDHRWTMQVAEPRALKLNGLEELPAGAEWTVAVQWIESGTGRQQRFSSEDGPDYAIWIQTEGTYSIEWRAPKLTASGQRNVRQTIRLSQAMIDGDQAIELTVPKAVLDALRSP